MSKKCRTHRELRAKKPTADDDDEDLAYCKEELFGRLKQAEKDAGQMLLPEFDSVGKIPQSPGI